MALSLAADRPKSSKTSVFPKTARVRHRPARLRKKFENLGIVIIHDGSGSHRRIGQLSNIQRDILKLLDLPDTAQKTFKRRCGM